ncbi:MAG TPA: response regulator [Azospirillaceae bacterium]|nr:response regulator [Azospirillaceae bacterium]
MSATPHLLVVDDEAISTMALERFLGRKGYRVSVAGDGVKALSLHRDDPADLVITDVRMPRMAGPELVGHLRTDDPELPVIVVSGYMGMDPEQAGLTGPRTVVLQKPVDVQELLRHVERLTDAV